MLVRDAGGRRWCGANHHRRLRGTFDAFVETHVAPYNAQVLEIKKRLPNARVGTVDKFQGQEAPIVLYSMTTSSPEDAPRGMEFLYSLNRFNVAISRAMCLAVVIASPKLFKVQCRTPRQMQLANALARFGERASTVPNK
ncbi:MAG: hypothetical protein KGN33_02785 [Paracoccaceae bacterium]|nr:hypothetical protein [Paracoccaceae bacterium]